MEDGRWSLSSTHLGPRLQNGCWAIQQLGIIDRTGLVSACLKDESLLDMEGVTSSILVSPTTETPRET